MAQNPLLRALKVSEKILTLEGVDYYVREMTADELDTLEEMLEEIRATSGKAKTSRGARALLICLTVCDAEGKRFFDEEKDFPALRSAPGGHFGELFKAAVKLNKLKSEEVEDIAKN